MLLGIGGFTLCSDLSGQLLGRRFPHWVNWPSYDIRTRPCSALPSPAQHTAAGKAGVTLLGTPIGAAAHGRLMTSASVATVATREDQEADSVPYPFPSNSPFVSVVVGRERSSQGEPGNAASSLLIRR